MRKRILACSDSHGERKPLLNTNSSLHRKAKAAEAMQGVLAEVFG